MSDAEQPAFNPPIMPAAGGGASGPFVPRTVTTEDQFAAVLTAPPAPQAARLHPALAVVVVGTWLGVALSVVQQKLAADDLLARLDPSAVQVQQLNGAVTAHTVVAVAVGLAVTCAVWALQAARR